MRVPQIVNIVLFAGTLSVLGGLLGVEAIAHSNEPEISLEENRTLAPFPAASWAAIVDGSFAHATDEWLADHFPARSAFMDMHFWLEEQRGFRPEQAVMVYAVEVDHDADLEPLGDDASMLEMLDRGLAPPEEVFEDELEVDLDEVGDAGEDPEVLRTKGILVVDGRAMQLFAGGPKGSRAYAKAINAYAGALPSSVKLYSLIVPTAQTYYLPESYAGKVREEPPNIKATYAMMDRSVITVDVVGALAGHEQEYIYFRTDHHWTGLGAYYAYVAFCKSAGLKPIGLDKMKKGTIDPYRGSLYRYTRDSKLHKQPDQIEYWMPPGEFSVERYTSASQKKPYDGALVNEQSKGYGVFLGGDHALLITRSKATSGRRALVIKNSYGNPFAVYLAAHFETVVIVDYRKFDGSVLDLVQEHNITDVVILNGAITANAGFHIDRVEEVLEGVKE